MMTFNIIEHDDSPRKEIVTKHIPLGDGNLLPSAVNYETNRDRPIPVNRERTCRDGKPFNIIERNSCSPEGDRHEARPP